MKKLKIQYLEVGKIYSAFYKGVEQEGIYKIESSGKIFENHGFGWKRQQSHIMKYLILLLKNSKGRLTGVKCHVVLRYKSKIGKEGNGRTHILLNMNPVKKNTLSK